MSIAVEDVVALFETRRRARGAHIARMVAVQKVYDGDIWLPLPEIDENDARQLPTCSSRA